MAPTRITAGFATDISYVLRTSCAWVSECLVESPARMRQYGAWGTVYNDFRQWRLDGTSLGIHVQLRELVWLRTGRDPTLSIAIIHTYGLNPVQTYTKYGNV